MNKRKQTLRDVDPHDTLRNPNGTNARSDQQVDTFVERHGQAVLKEQLTRPATHVATGNTYQFLSYAEDATNGSDREYAVYYGSDGKLYVREKEEFDSRFAVE